MFKGVKVLDVHGHTTPTPHRNAFLVNILTSNAAARSPLDPGAARRGSGNFGAQMEIPNEAYEVAAASHAKYMDERNIDVQIIGPRPFTMLGWMKPHLLPSWCRYTNDATAKQCSLRPDRFLGAAMLPQISEAPDLTNCIEELERCVKEYGFVGAYVSPDPGGDRKTPGMHDPYWYPLYARCQELGIPLIVHGTNSRDDRVAFIPANYQIGFVTEQFIATQILSRSDVFDRFPELKVVVCHCGGALDRFVSSAGWRGRRDIANNLFFDTCAYDRDFLATAIKQRGVDQMLFGTEAPGSGGSINPETGKSSDHLVEVIDSFDFLSDEEKLKIINGNAVKVFPKLTEM
jgi:predicted TIM-barrel fold metal-dependent hydrolase